MDFFFRVLSLETLQKINTMQEQGTSFSQMREDKPYSRPTFEHELREDKPYSRPTFEHELREDEPYSRPTFEHELREDELGGRG
jgi:hypothetical protein